MKGPAQDPPANPWAAPYLGALIQEGVPDLEENVADETVSKDHEEPVEGDAGEVHVVLPQVGHQFGQLLREEVLEHPLVYLEAGERTVSAAPSHPGSPHAILELLSEGPPCPRGTEHLAAGRHRHHGTWCCSWAGPAGFDAVVLVVCSGLGQWSFGPLVPLTLKPSRSSGLYGLTPGCPSTPI